MVCFSFLWRQNRGFSPSSRQRRELGSHLSESGRGACSPAAKRKIFVLCTNTLVPPTIFGWSVFLSFGGGTTTSGRRHTRRVCLRFSEISRLCIPPTAVSCHARRCYSPLVRAERYPQTKPRAANPIYFVLYAKSFILSFFYFSYSAKASHHSTPRFAVDFGEEMCYTIIAIL